jgi:hypothetical protein
MEQITTDEVMEKVNLALSRYTTLARGAHA